MIHCRPSVKCVHTTRPRHPARGNPRSIAILAALSAFIVLSGESRAFHSGGSGFCVGCHRAEITSRQTLKEAQDPGGWIPSGDASPGAMLRGMDASSTCLRCHAGALDTPSVLGQLSPSRGAAGDFYWLKRNFSWLSGGQQRSSSGNSHGHNIVAVEYGLWADPSRSVAPGGTYPAQAMSCISCHDPHAVLPSPSTNDQQASTLTQNLGAKRANYRLLGGRDYQGGAAASGISFRYAAPIAVASDKTWNESETDHPAYGSGMSEWCANCHGGILDGRAKHGHPAGRSATLGRRATIYNAYRRTGDLTGDSSRSYLPLVPFEQNVDNVDLLDPTSQAGPGGSASVMCVSCHRAHASPFASAGRWDFSVTFLAQSHPALGDLGATGNDVSESYGGRSVVSQFGEHQRQLCNKCHGQD